MEFDSSCASWYADRGKTLVCHGNVPRTWRTSRFTGAGESRRRPADIGWVLLMAGGRPGRCWLRNAMAWRSTSDGGRSGKRCWHGGEHQERRYARFDQTRVSAYVRSISGESEFSSLHFVLSPVVNRKRFRRGRHAEFARSSQGKTGTREVPPAGLAGDLGNVPSTPILPVVKIAADATTPTRIRLPEKPNSTHLDGTTIHGGNP